VLNLKQLAMYPPPVCRVIARRTVVIDGKRKVVPISSHELAEKSGLSIRRVLWISEQPNWMNIKLADMVAFLTGCELLSVSVWRLKWFLQRSSGKAGGLSHLEHLPDEDRKRVSRNFHNNITSWQADVQRYANT